MRCECCGTTEGLENKGMWLTTWYCGPTNNCEKNKELRSVEVTA